MLCSASPYLLFAGFEIVVGEPRRVVLENELAELPADPAHLFVDGPRHERQHRGLLDRLSEGRNVQEVRLVLRVVVVLRRDLVLLRRGLREDILPDDLVEELVHLERSHVKGGA